MKSKLTLLVISLIIGGIFGEIVLRQFSFLKTYSERSGEPFSTYYGLKLPSWYLTLPPNSTVSRKTPEFDYTFKTNSEGLRGDEISAKQDSVFRIIVLGDSYTEGVGADADDETWGKYLESTLSSSLQLNFEVINAGISASDPFQEFVLLRDKLLRYQPNLVIMAINNSDVDDFTFRGGMERFKPDGTTEYRKAPGIHSFYKCSFLFRLLTHSVLGYDKTFIKYSARDKENARACSEVAGVLKEADSLCANNNCSFIAVLHSRGGEQKKKMKHGWLLNYFKPVQRDIAGTKKYSGFRLIDISAPFNSFITDENFKELVWEQDAHYTPKGYKRMADLIADSLLANEIICHNSKKY